MIKLTYFLNFQSGVQLQLQLQPGGGGLGLLPRLRVRQHGAARRALAAGPVPLLPGQDRRPRGIHHRAPRGHGLHCRAVRR